MEESLISPQAIGKIRLVHNIMCNLFVKQIMKGFAIINYIPAATVVGTKLTVRSVSVDRP